jgi:monoamine oxidase
VLEARDRVGGRVVSIHDPTAPLPIELGAEFIHGRPPALWRLVRAARLGVYEVGGTVWRSRASQFAPIDDVRSKIDAVMHRMERVEGDDRSFAAFLETVRREESIGAAIPFARAFVEGFDAADPERISVLALIREYQAAAAVEGERSFRLIGGYDAVPRWLAAGLDPETAMVRLNTMVTEIRWQRGHVTVLAHTRSGQQLEPFVAPRAILTLPLGVLQVPAGARGAVRLVPEPAAVLGAARRLAMGQAVKVTFRFREPFWEDAQVSRAGFLLTHDEAIPTWWTSYPVCTPLLTGWAGGPAGSRLAQLGEAAIVDRALQALARVLGVARGQIEAMLEAWYLHNWQADPFTRGAYSYVPVGALDAVETLAQPVDNTLFFAGEATDTSGHTGTVHGALATGERAARQVLRGIGEG